MNQQNRLLRVAAVIQSIYAGIEVADCITVCLIALGWIANPYPLMVFPEMQKMFDIAPGWVIPLFLFYTMIRIVSAVGLWKNRLWGAALTIFVILATIWMAPFLFPFTTAEMLLNGVLVILLMIGIFGKTAIPAEIHLPERSTE